MFKGSEVRASLAGLRSNMAGAEWTRTVKEVMSQKFTRGSSRGGMQLMWSWQVPLWRSRNKELGRRYNPSSDQTWGTRPRTRFLMVEGERQEGSDYNLKVEMTEFAHKLDGGHGRKKSGKTQGFGFMSRRTALPPAVKGEVVWWEGRILGLHVLAMSWNLHSFGTFLSKLVKAADWLVLSR